MKRYTIALLSTLFLTVLFSSCSIFKKAQVSPPVVQKEAPPAVTPPKKEIPPSPKTEPAPFDVPAFAKEIYKSVYNIALFAPLDIDEVVTDTGFSTTSRQPLPPATLSGLEFYEGVLLAVDSLQQEGLSIQMTVYDTKSTTKPLSTVLRGGPLDSANLIIGDVNSNELKGIAAFAKQHQINFISATYPNDAGITHNPFLTILNSTLQIHCFAIQNFAQQKFSNKNILVIYQDNAQDRLNLEYMQEAYNKMNYPFKVPLRPFEWNNNTTAGTLLPYLDKSKDNVVVIVSLYPQVAESIIGQLIPLTKTYQIDVVGMPTLDGDHNLVTNPYDGINIYYSTPFPYYNLSKSNAITSVMWQYFKKYRARPSGMALKGYEAMFYFGNLLRKGGIYFNKNMNDPQSTILTRFNIQPIYKDNKTNEAPDYFENTHLYFVQLRDGKLVPGN